MGVSVSGAALSTIDSWGQKLLTASLVYTVIAMIVTYTALASGANPPPLVPSQVYSLYVKAYSQWESIRGKVFSGNAWDQLVALFNSLQAMWNLVLTVVFTVTFSFIWMGYLAGSMLPEPFTILRIAVWSAAVFANLIMLIYLFRLVSGVVSNFIYYIRGG